MKKPKGTTFEVHARIVSCVSCKVDANTMEEALVIARALKSEDFLRIDSDCELLDDNVTVTGAFHSKLNYNTDQQP